MWLWILEKIRDCDNIIIKIKDYDGILESKKRKKSDNNVCCCKHMGTWTLVLKKKELIFRFEILDLQVFCGIRCEMGNRW
jgi:predicted RNase H-like nuclease